MNTGRLFDRHRELQSYVSWTDDDARWVGAVVHRIVFGNRIRNARDAMAEGGD